MYDILCEPHSNPQRTYQKLKEKAIPAYRNKTEKQKARRGNKI